jgi:hypothetical protein
MPILSYTPSTLEARVGIGRLKRRFRPKNATFSGPHKLTLGLLDLTLSLHLC